MSQKWKEGGWGCSDMLEVYTLLSGVIEIVNLPVLNGYRYLSLLLELVRYSIQAVLLKQNRI